MEFARKLEQGEVTIYAKLPNGFKIRTPFGNYNPDWALVFDNKDIKYIYFIAETKGSMQSAQIIWTSNWFDNRNSSKDNDDLDDFILFNMFFNDKK